VLRRPARGFDFLVAAAMVPVIFGQKYRNERLTTHCLQDHFNFIEVGPGRRIAVPMYVGFGLSTAVPSALDDRDTMAPFRKPQRRDAATETRADHQPVEVESSASLRCWPVIRAAFG
jgi:hypothetical protein